MPRDKISFKFNRSAAGSNRQRWQAEENDASDRGLLQNTGNDQHVTSAHHVASAPGSLGPSLAENPDMINQQIIVAGMNALASSLLAQLVQDGSNTAIVDPIIELNNLSTSLVGGNMKSSIPDGRGLIRYRAPDMDAFIFDSNTGYRFDATTGLHYDANSGLFINHDLEILLRWDPVSSTYLRTGDLTSLQPATGIAVHSAAPQTSGAVYMSPALNNQPNNAYIPRNPGTDVRIDGISANPLLGARKSRNQTATQLEIYKSRERRTSEASRSRERRNARDREASRSRSGSPVRQSKYSDRIYSGISRGRSSSSSNQSTGRQSRRSVSRGRKRYRSHSSEARRSSVTFRRNLSRSQSPHRHQEVYSRDHTLSDRQRHGRNHSLSRSGSPACKSNYSGGIHSGTSRRRSPSSSKQSGERQLRRRSVSRKRKSYGSDSRELRRSNVPFRRNFSRSQSPHEHQEGCRDHSCSDRQQHDGNRSVRSKSGSSAKRNEYSAERWASTSRSRSPSRSQHPEDRQSRRRPRYRSHSREARKSNVGFRKRSPRSRSPHRYREGDSKESASDAKQLKKINTSETPARKGDVWNRLGSCSIKQKFGATNPTDPQKDSQTAMTGRNQSKSGSGRKKSPLLHLDDEYVVLDECREPLDDELMTANETPAFNETETTGKDGKGPLELDDEDVMGQETREDESTLNNDAPAPKEAQTSETKIVDMGDVLGHLFTDNSHIFTNILLVAPVPLQTNSSDERDALTKQLGDPEDIFKLYVNHENTSGLPCHFMVVSFKRAIAAKKWYDFLQGTILLSGEDGSKMKAYLHFMKKGNWNCKHCKGFNLFMQSICSKCYQTNGIGFSPVRICEGPSKWVGIARLNSNFSTTKSVIESLPPLHSFNILSTKIIREPSGLPLGLCVFEVESDEEGFKLHEFLLQQERNAIYVGVNEKPKNLDVEYLSLLFNKMSPTNILLVALIPLSRIPDMKFELTLMEMYLLMLLKEDDVKYEQITFHVDKDVGAPYSYGLITFTDAETAGRWLQSRRTTFESVAGEEHSSQQGTIQRSKISVHFSGNNWECHSCHSQNFFLRSLCHGCFKHRLKKKLGPISKASITTNCVAVSDLSNWSKADEHIVTEFGKLLKIKSGSEFKLTKIEVVRDSECQLLPLACVFEMQGEEDSLRLKEFLTKEGRLSVFVNIHKETVEATTVDLSEDPDDVMIVDEKPVCIDLTSEDNDTQLIKKSQIIPQVIPSLMSIDLIKSYTQYSNDCVVAVYPVHQFRDLHGEELQNCYTQIFRIDGAACEFAEFCAKDLFGVPHDYCLVYFRNPELAKRWCDKNQGEIRIATYRTGLRGLRYNRSKLELLGPNWSCHCGIENCPRRSLCYKCFTQRGKVQITLEYSSSPTKYLGINVRRNVEILPELKCCMSDLVNVRYIGDPRWSTPSRDKYGVYILETKSPHVTSRLYKLYINKKAVISASFVVLKDPNAGDIVDLKRENLKECPPKKIIPSDSDYGQSQVMVCPDYDTFIWTSSFAFRLDNPPTNIIMVSLCPGNLQLPDEAKAQICTSLTGSGVSSATTTFSCKKDVGSPFSYCSVFFKTVDEAEMWFNKCRGTFQFDVPCPVDKNTPLNFQNCYTQEAATGEKIYFIKSMLHYTERNWTCICGTSNFPLRMVCHKCFQNKSNNSPYLSVSDATDYVGIRLAKFLDEDFDVSAFYKAQKLGYKIRDVKVCLDTSFPRDPHGIVIIRMANIDEGIRFHKFLTESIHSYQPKKEQNQDELVKRLKVVLDESQGVTFIKCQPPLHSSHNFVQSDNWDRLFNNKTLTNIIAIYPHINVNNMKCGVPFDRYGGEMKPFKASVNRQLGFKPDFSFIYFPTPQKAKHWYDANGGRLKNNLYQQALYFTQDFWTCRSCGVKNFPVRILCHGCYEHKLGTNGVFSPLKISNIPTRWVGITRQCDQKEAFVSATSSFQFRSIQVIADPNVLQDGTSVLIFEVSTPYPVGSALRNFFAQKNFNSSFFEISEREKESSTSVTQNMPSTSTMLEGTAPVDLAEGTATADLTEDPNVSAGPIDLICLDD